LELIWDLEFDDWNFWFWRSSWHIKKQEEVPETAEIVLDNVWASNDSADNRSRQETS